MSTHLLFSLSRGFYTKALYSLFFLPPWVQAHFQSPLDFITLTTIDHLYAVVKIPLYAVPYITHFSSLGSKYFHALYHLK